MKGCAWVVSAGSGAMRTRCPPTSCRDRRLRGIRGHEAVRAFVRAGGVMRQGKGDHINIKMPTGAIITLPWSKELKIGLLKSAISKTGLTEEEFLELL